MKEDHDGPADAKNNHSRQADGTFIASLRRFRETFRLVRPIRRLPQLEAYANAMVDNLPDPGSAKALRDKVEILIRLREAGELDDVSFFLSIKAIEYRVISALQFNTRELGWFLRYDLLQTPASEMDVERLRERFLGDDKREPAPIESPLFARIIHVAIGQWQQYAETLQKAIQRERQISLYLAVALLAYFAFLAVAGLRELVPEGFASWHWRALGDWFIATKDFYYLAFGGLGAVVSITLAERAVVATRPFDDLYQFWSKIPKLLIGMIAGLLAPPLLSMLATLVTGPAGGTVLQTQAAQGTESIVGHQFLSLLFAFSAGFSDRLFFDKLVKATWKKSGLEVSDKE